MSWRWKALPMLAPVTEFRSDLERILHWKSRHLEVWQEVRRGLREMGGNDRRDEGLGTPEALISRSQGRREPPCGNQRRKATADKASIREAIGTATEVAGADEGYFVLYTDTYHLGWYCTWDRPSSAPDSSLHSGQAIQTAREGSGLSSLFCKYSEAWLAVHPRYALKALTWVTINTYKNPCQIRPSFTAMKEEARAVFGLIARSGGEFEGTTLLHQGHYDPNSLSACQSRVNSTFRVSRVAQSWKSACRVSHQGYKWFCGLGINIFNSSTLQPLILKLYMRLY